MSNRYGICRRFGMDGEYGEWLIQDYSGSSVNPPTVWHREATQDDENYDPYPPDLCAEYERLVGRPEFVDYDDPPEMPNIVEMMADEDDCAWDQPCAFGYRVEFHAVYCHNEKWLYSPSKCRRNSTDWPHEKCRGFKPNPLINKPKDDQA